MPAFLKNWEFYAAVIALAGATQYLANKTMYATVPKKAAPLLKSVLERENASLPVDKQLPADIFADIV